MTMINQTNQLSEREQEILRLVAAGLSNQQIAYQLGISVNTVKVHLRNVFGKIGVASRTEATMYAVRAGIVAVGQPQAEVPADVDAEQPTMLGAEAAPDIASRLQPQLDATVSVPPARDDVVTMPEVETTQVGAHQQAPAAATPVRQYLLAIVGGLVIISVIVGVWALERQDNQAAQASPAPSANQPTASSSDNRWHELPDVRTPRAAFAIASVGERIYVIGGENETGVMGSMERYDARSETWTELSQKPTPVADTHAVVIGGKLYIPGGRTSSEPQSVTNVFERYDPITQAWERLPDLPQPRSGYALATLEGKLYLFGGWDGTSYRQEAWEYDPERENWRERTVMPTARAFAEASVVDGDIYVLGGENEDGPLASNEMYTPAEEGAQPWEKRAPLLQPRSHFGSTVALSNVYVLGGEPTDAAPLMYDVRTDSWQTLDVPPQAIGSNPGVALLDTMVMSIGGLLEDDTYSSQMQGYQALYKIFQPTQ
jgi:DNA-binding CsgD family transcriptional regulator